MGKLLTVEPKYTYAKKLLKIFVHVIIIYQCNSTTRLYAIQETLIYSCDILVTVTSKCRVKMVICKPDLGHWQTVQTKIRRHQNTASDQVMLITGTLGLNESVLSPHSGLMSQSTPRNNRPSSVVSVLNSRVSNVLFSRFPD